MLTTSDSLRFTRPSFCYPEGGGKETWPGLPAGSGVPLPLAQIPSLVFIGLLGYAVLSLFDTGIYWMTTGKLTSTSVSPVVQGSAPDLSGKCFNMTVSVPVPVSPV
ncbi:MAG: hypothetical protein RLY31_947 [Bacteroidota bacterium]